MALIGSEIPETPDDKVYADNLLTICDTLTNLNESDLIIPNGTICLIKWTDKYKIGTGDKFFRDIEEIHEVVDSVSGGGLSLRNFMINLKMGFIENDVHYFHISQKIVPKTFVYNPDAYLYNKYKDAGFRGYIRSNYWDITFTSNRVNTFVRKVGETEWKATPVTLNYPENTYEFEFKAPTGYINPANEIINLNDNITRHITIEAKQVTFTANVSGVQYRVQGTNTWYDLSVPITIFVGDVKTIEFSNVSGYMTPASQSISIESPNSISITYAAVPEETQTFYLRRNVNQTSLASTEDGDPVIFYVDGDYTIPSGTTITPTQRCKGLYMFINGTLTNNGTISMTARGANAEGRFVGINALDFSNPFIQYCTSNIYSSQGIPWIGNTTGTPAAGTKIDGVNNCCGSGGYDTNTGVNKGGQHSPGNGTSFSGGAGSGSKYHGSAGKPNGGEGGSDASGCGTAGAGNPGGSNTKTRAPSGTGGLIIIVAKSIINNGSIVSNGTNTADGQPMCWSAGFSHGGGSGGGSIQMFYKDTLEQGIITVTAGSRAGTGSIRTMKLSS